MCNNILLIPPKSPTKGLAHPRNQHTQLVSRWLMGLHPKFGREKIRVRPREALSKKSDTWKGAHHLLQWKYTIIFQESLWCFINSPSALCFYIIETRHVKQLLTISNHLSSWHDINGYKWIQMVYVVRTLPTALGGEDMGPVDHG